MMRPLRDHLVGLELRLQTLRGELTRHNLTSEERRQVEMKMRISERALRLYIKAFELERKGE